MRRDNSSLGRGGVSMISPVTLALLVFTVWIVAVPAGADAASVTRELPDYAKPNETFVVTLTQSEFLFNAGVVWEVLPEGFEYVDGSYTGGGEVDWDPTTRTLTMEFYKETTIAYSVNASSYDQTAVFSGTWKTFSMEGEITGEVTGDIEVVVDGTLPEISNVASSSITTNSATITWTTNEISDSLVKYGTASGVYTLQEYEAADVTAHSVDLTELSANTTYYYVVNSTDPGGNSAESAEYSFTALAEPDLVIIEVTLNCGYLFANESNEICGVIKNNGGSDAGAFNVSFGIDAFGEEVRVDGLAADASTTVCVNDSTERKAGESVTTIVIADCEGEISEANETNNVTVREETVVNNGYKGKRYTGGDDITTWKTVELKGNMLYSPGDSYYLNASIYPHWTVYTANWTAGNLSVPVGASIEEARLYVIYRWDKAGVMHGEVNMTFNDEVQALDAHYSDRKGHGSWNYSSGMLAYNVTEDFKTSGNSAVLTNSHAGGGNVSMQGMFLMVIYGDESEAKRKIIVNEGFDLLYGGSSECTTVEEATAFAPLAGVIANISNKSARLITVAPGASGSEGELIFNGHKWTDVWNFAGATEIGIDDRDVTAYLNTTNEAEFQSSGDYMEASNAILVVEHKDTEAPVVMNATAMPNVILNDNGRERATGTNVSRINVTVTDDAGVANVSIDLSPIGGSATQPMERIEGTDIWTVTTNASSGINVTNYLLVNATDVYGKFNNTVSVPLEVLRRGDVVRDNVVDMKDMEYIARYSVGLEPEASNPPSVPVGDVVGEDGDPCGDGKVDMKDALYIARWTVELEQEP